MPASSQQIEALRRTVARIEDRRPLDADRFLLGHEDADALLGGLSRRGLHEVHAASSADMASADGFSLGLALRAAGPNNFIVWIIQSMAEAEAGMPYGEGIRAWGLDPGRILFVRTRDTRSLLAAAEDALRSGAVGAVVMSVWGAPRMLGLTAERRLGMAARNGTAAILVRSGCDPAPGAAQTRWIIRSAPSRPLEAGAPGRPTLGVRLARSRSGLPPREWIMEWDSETRGFVQSASIPGALVPLVADRPAASSRPGDGYRHAG